MWNVSQKLIQDSINFVGFAYQGKDMVFRFIIEYKGIFIGP
jgi:hypothetical protein